MAIASIGKRNKTQFQPVKHRRDQKTIVKRATSALNVNVDIKSVYRNALVIGLVAPGVATMPAPALGGVTPEL
jgi:hypothetical protein